MVDIDSKEYQEQLAREFEEEDRKRAKREAAQAAEEEARYQAEMDKQAAKQRAKDIKANDRAAAAKLKKERANALENTALELRRMLQALPDTYTKEELLPITLLAVKGITFCSKDSLLYDTFLKRLAPEKV